MLGLQILTRCRIHGHFGGRMAVPGDHSSPRESYFFFIFIFYRGRVQRSRCEHVHLLSFGMQCGLEELMGFEVQKNHLMEKVNTQLLISVLFGSM